MAEPEQLALARTRRGKGGEIQLTDAIRAVIQNGGRAYGVRLRPGERRYDIGNFEAYFEAFVAFALADPRFGPALRRHLLDALDRTTRGKGGEIQLTDAIRAVIRDGGRAYGVRLRPNEKRYDIGNFEAYFEAFVAFALADPQYGPAFRRHLLDILDVPHA